MKKVIQEENFAEHLSEECEESWKKYSVVQGC